MVIASLCRFSAFSFCEIMCLIINFDIRICKTVNMSVLSYLQVNSHSKTA